MVASITPWLRILFAAGACAKDRVVPPDRGEMILKEITKAGGKQAKVIVLPDMGHNAGRVPHGDPEFYKWLYGNKRQRK